MFDDGCDEWFKCDKVLGLDGSYLAVIGFKYVSTWDGELYEVLY